MTQQTRLSGLHTAWPVSKTLTIKTERFVVRSAAAHDITQPVLAWFHEAPFKRSFPGVEAPESLDALKETLRPNATGTKRSLVIAHEDQPIGIFWVETSQIGEIALTHHFLGDRHWWGKGVIHETRAYLIDALFKLGIHKVVGMPRADNRGVVQTYRDQGFVEEGRLRQHYRKLDGGKADVIYFGLLREEWDFATARQLPESVRRRLRRQT